MTDEAKDPFSAIGTLSAQMLAVMAILTKELVRSKSVDAGRLQKELDFFWADELNGEGLSAADRRMVESVKKIISAVIQEGAQK